MLNGLLTQYKIHLIYTDGDNEVNSPEFADIDNDGDLDYLSGEYTYSIGYGVGYGLGFHFQENIGSATNPNFANPIINPFGLNL